MLEQGVGEARGELARILVQAPRNPDGVTACGAGFVMASCFAQPLLHVQETARDISVTLGSGRECLSCGQLLLASHEVELLQSNGRVREPLDDCVDEFRPGRPSNRASRRPR
jgi:hypothetical protein